MNAVARSFVEQQRQKDAQTLFEQVIALRRRVLGAEHPDTLTSMFNLANLLRQQKRFDEARKLGEETLEIRRRVLGSQHPDTLLSMGELAIVLCQQERLDDARKLLEEALPLQRRVLTAEHPDTLGSMHYLGYILLRQGQYAAACRLNEETLEIQRRVLGAAHSDTLASINNVAWLLATAPDAGARDPARAIELATELVRLLPGEGNSWNTLGVAQYRAGDWRKAVSALEKSLELHRGKPEVDQGDAYSGFFLAMAYWQLGKAEQGAAQEQARHRQEARRWYGRAVAWTEKYEPRSEELRRFRAEAAEVLGIQEPPPKVQTK
jgi:tetratricopeptide (TPR) repeat protein